MALFNRLFNRNADAAAPKDARPAAAENHPDASPATGGPDEEAVADALPAFEDADGGADEPAPPAAPPLSMPELDAILDTVEQIDGIIGDGEGEADEPPEADLALPLWELLRLVPEALRRQGAVDPAEQRRQAVSLQVPDLLDQLAAGQVQMPLASLLAAIPGELLVENPQVAAGQQVTLPLSSVVAAIPPDFLNRQRKTPQREIGLDHLPDPFTPQAETVTGEKPRPADTATLAEARPTVVPTPPAPGLSEQAPPTVPVQPDAPAVSVPAAPRPAPSGVVPGERVAPPPAEPDELPETPSALPAEPVQPEPPRREAAAITPPPPAPLPETPADAPVLPLRGIDVNRAGLRDLCKRLPGIGPKTAEELIRARPFTSVYDLRNIPGIGARQFFRITGEHLPPTGAVAEVIEGVLGPATQHLPNLREVALRIAGLNGVHGCLISHVEGHLLAAANAGKAHQSFGAIAPQIMKSLEKYMDLLRLESPSSVTVFTDPKPFHIARCGNLFLIVSIPRTRFSIRRINLMENILGEIVRRLHRHSENATG